MKFTPSTTYNTIAKAGGIELNWTIYTRTTTTLSGSLTSGTWTEVTRNINKIPGIDTKLEYIVGSYSADSIKLIGFDIDFWKDNIFTSASLQDDTKYIEFKVVVNTGLGSLLSENIIPFYGFANKESITYKNDTNTLEFEVYTPEVLADKTPAYTINTQYILNDSTLGNVLVLPRIPGVFVLNANTGSLPLKTGIHKLTYNSDTETLKLDEGREWYLTASMEIGLSTKTAEETSIYGDTELLRVYVDSADILRGPSTYEDYVIVTNQGDTLPKQPFYSFNLNESIKKIYNQMGVEYTSSDSFTVNTWDTSSRPSFINIPPDTTTGVIATCNTSDTFGEMLYGIGNKVYASDDTCATYRLVASSSSNTGDVIKRILHNPTTDLFWIYYVTGSDHLFRKMERTFTTQYDYYTNPITPWFTVGEIGHKANLHPRRMEIYYPEYSASSYHDYVVFYANDNLGLYYISSSNSGSLVALSTQVNYPNAQGLHISDSKVVLSGLHDDGFAQQQCRTAAHEGTGGWVIDDAPKFVYRYTSEQITYNEYNGNFYSFNTASNTIYKQTTNANETALGSPKTGVFSNNLTFFNPVDSETIIVINKTEIPDESYMIRIHPITEAVTFTDIPNIVSLVTTGVPVKRLVLNTTGMLYLLTTTPSLSIAPSFQYINLSLREYLNKLLSGFNLVGTINSNKQAKVLRRVDSAGNIVTTGDTLTLTENDVIKVSADFNKYKAAKFVQLTAESKTTSFDGTNFDIGSFSNTRKVVVTSEVIPDILYKDCVVPFYRFFSVDRVLVTVACINSNFQWELFDAVNLNIANTNLGNTINGTTGIIYDITYNADGTSVLGILV